MCRGDLKRSFFTSQIFYMKHSVGSPGWEKTGVDAFWGEIAPCDHILQLYENDEDFLKYLEGFITSGLYAGDSVIVIATSDPPLCAGAMAEIRGFDLFPCYPDYSTVNSNSQGAYWVKYRQSACNFGSAPRSCVQLCARTAGPILMLSSPN